jgi:hypothetical protein
VPHGAYISLNRYEGVCVLQTLTTWASIDPSYDYSDASVGRLEAALADSHMLVGRYLLALCRL